jgi:hypothetical protein
MGKSLELKKCQINYIMTIYNKKTIWIYIHINMIKMQKN